jgi:hypothetical protein
MGELMHRLHAIKFVSTLNQPQIVHVKRSQDMTGGQVILHMFCRPLGRTRWVSCDYDMDIVAENKIDIYVTGDGEKTMYWDDDYPRFAEDGWEG